MKLKTIITEIEAAKMKQYQKLHKQFVSQFQKYERSGYVSKLRNIKFEAPDRSGIISTTIEFDYEYKIRSGRNLKSDGRFYFTYGAELQSGDVSEHWELVIKGVGAIPFRQPIQPKKVVDYLLFEHYEIAK